MRGNYEESKDRKKKRYGRRIRENVVKENVPTLRNAQYLPGGMYLLAPLPIANLS